MIFEVTEGLLSPKYNSIRQTLGLLTPLKLKLIICSVINLRVCPEMNLSIFPNKNSVLDVKIQKSDATLPPVYGAVKGKGWLAVYLDLVPVDSEINSGDVLITSALEGIFPKDLLVGKITSKDKNDLKPFQTASIDPFFDVKKTDKLFVITDYMKTK